MAIAKGQVFLLIGLLILTPMRASATRYSLENQKEQIEESDSISLSDSVKRKLLGHGNRSPPHSSWKPPSPPPTAWITMKKKTPSKCPPPPPYRSGPSPSQNASMIARFLNPHNAARSRLKLPHLTWDPKLAKYADWWANDRRLHGNCKPKHSNTGGRYGENIFWGKGSSWTPEFAINAFVNENKYYNYAANTCQKGKICGHYTQIVWRETKRVGCALVICLNSDTFISCNYEPPGNYIGERPY